MLFSPAVQDCLSAGCTVGSPFTPVDVNVNSARNLNSSTADGKFLLTSTPFHFASVEFEPKAPMHKPEVCLVTPIVPPPALLSSIGKLDVVQLPVVVQASLKYHYFHLLCYILN